MPPSILPVALEVARLFLQSSPWAQLRILVLFGLVLGLAWLVQRP